MIRTRRLNSSPPTSAIWLVRLAAVTSNAGLVVLAARDCDLERFGLAVGRLPSDSLERRRCKLAQCWAALEQERPATEARSALPARAPACGECYSAGRTAEMDSVIGAADSRTRHASATYSKPNRRQRYRQRTKGVGERSERQIDDRNHVVDCGKGREISPGHRPAKQTPMTPDNEG